MLESRFDKEAREHFASLSKKIEKQDIEGNKKEASQISNSMSNKTEFPPLRINITTLEEMHKIAHLFDKPIIYEMTSRCLMCLTTQEKGKVFYVYNLGKVKGI